MALRQRMFGPLDSGMERFLNPAASDEEFDSWLFQTEALLHDDPRRLAIFRLPEMNTTMGAVTSMREVMMTEQQRRMDRYLHQLEEVIKGLPR